MKLLDNDGENQAVRWFLACYGGGGSKTIGAMKAHLKMSGFDGCWPDWCNTEHPSTHLTKGGAQLWIRHLFNLEAQQAKQVPMTQQELLDLMPTNTSMTRHDALEWMARAVERHHDIHAVDKPADWSAA